MTKESYAPPPDVAESEKRIRDLEARVEVLERDNAGLREKLSQQRITNQRLLDGQEHFRTIVDSEPACVKLVDTKGIIISMNPAGVALAQASSADEIVGVSVFELVDSEDHEAFAELNRRVFAGESCSLEFGITGIKGGRSRMETHAAPLRDATGKIVAHLGITHDITSRKRDQEELMTYRDHLEDLVSQRTDELSRSREATLRAERLASLGTLAAGVAHELNNPLGTIRLAAEYALQSENIATIRSALEGIRKDVDRCGRIVTSVLKFNREEPSDKWSLCLNAIVRFARDRTRSLANQAGVAVDLELDESLDQTLGNETELERVLINLIDNAIRATPPGGRVVVRTSASEGHVWCEVEDAGSGMEPEHLERVFDPFFTTRLETGGTGLGLSVSHGIVRDHDGTIEIESSPGVGTTISLRFRGIATAEQAS